MCGSGTIPIEAYQLARATPRRAHALEALAIAVPEGATSRSPSRCSPMRRRSSSAAIIDLDVLAAARDNARAAGVGGGVTWQRADVATLTPEMIADIARERGREPPETGVLLANPPYGERLDERDLARALLAHSRETCRRFEGWRAGVPRRQPAVRGGVRATSLGRPRIKKPLANANLRAYFYLYEL